MRVKKILLLLIFFLIIFSIHVNADETIDFNMENIVSTFNNHSYVKRLNGKGFKIYAIERTNRYTVRIRNTELTYVYDDVAHSLHAQIPTSTSETDYLELVNALFIDTLSSMQGNNEGDLICTVLCDYYSSTSITNDGIEETEQTMYNGDLCKDYKINPFVKFTVPNLNSPIPRDLFAANYSNLIDDTNTFIYYENLVCLKYIDDDGKVVIYLGEPKENSNTSKESIKTLLFLLYNEKVATYFDKNINDLNQETSVDGLNIQAHMDSLPFVESRTLILPNDMAYVKVVIDEEVVKQKAKEMPDEPTKEPRSISGSSVPLTSAIVVIALVIIIFLIGIIKRHLDEN